MRSWGHAGAGALLVLSAVPAQADVIAKSDTSFVVRVAVEVTASPAESWRKLITPAGWWSSQHTFSGDAANLTLDPVPGGCFCEKLPVPKDAPKGQAAGGVQHLRVVYAEPPRAIRMTGAMGPLQSEALSGTMTMTVKPTEKGSRILWEYVVGGYMRYNVNDIAPAVDRMLTGQITALAEKLGPVGASAPAGPPASAPPPTAAPSLSVDETRAPARAPEDLPPVPKAKPAPAKPAAKPAPKVGMPKPAPAPATIAPSAKSAPSPKPVAKPPVKVAKPKPSTPAVDPEHSDANAAFDAALGGTSPQ